MFGPECHLLEAQSDHPGLQRCADRARLTLRVRVALDAAQILSPAQGETGLMLTSGRMRLDGEFQREPIRREAEAFQPEPKWRLAGTFQPEPTPPLAVRYLLGWASQPYGLG